jgi:hypothetical protein
VDIVRAFVGIHDLEVDEMPDRRAQSPARPPHTVGAPVSRTMRSIVGELLFKQHWIAPVEASVNVRGHPHRWPAWKIDAELSVASMIVVDLVHSHAIGRLDASTPSVE